MSNHIQAGLDHFLGWGAHNFSEQAVLVPHSKECHRDSESEPTPCQSEAITPRPVTPRPRSLSKAFQGLTEVGGGAIPGTGASCERGGGEKRRAGPGRGCPEVS